MATTIDAERDTDEGPPIPWRAVVACLAAAFLGVGLGLFLRRDDRPAATSVDVRFLQDMRFHHEQAVGMSLMLLDKSAAAGNATLRTIAREIIQSQSFEGGRMAQMLSDFGGAVANERETAMEWMGMATPLGEMPGMATPDDTAALAEATGAAADALYVRLIVAHHEGGIHMATFASTNARRDAVRAFAASMVTSQRSEIAELRTLASTLRP